LTDSDVVQDGTDNESTNTDAAARRRRLTLLLVPIIALILLLWAWVTVSEMWLIGSEQQARFVASNIECLQCHTELIPDFNKETVHNPFALRQCDTCHTPHGKEVRVTVAMGPQELFTRYRLLAQWLPLRWWLSLSEITEARGVATQAATRVNTVKVTGGPSYLIAAETELCWTCHGSMGAKLSETYQHVPFATGRCTGCHDPHASDEPALLTQRVNEICFTCHPIGTEIGRAQPHPPAFRGWCVDCHDPHASEFKGILVTNQRDLCFSCHPTVAGLSGMPVQHAPFLNDACTGCHQPHGSDYPPLLNAIQPDICYDCHPAIEQQFGEPSHHPVGVTLECDTCHDPHAAQYAGLLSAQNNNSFCYECHAQIRPTFSDSDHKEQLCVQCHTPHGSAFKPLLVKRNPEVCFKCHDSSGYDESSKSTARNKHPVRSNHYDINNESPLTCTSSCHNPHGTDKAHMLRYFASPYDGGCLMCHAVTEGARVGVDY